MHAHSRTYMHAFGTPNNTHTPTQPLITHSQMFTSPITHKQVFTPHPPLTDSHTVHARMGGPFILYSLSKLLTLRAAASSAELTSSRFYARVVRA